MTEDDIYNARTIKELSTLWAEIANKAIRTREAHPLNDFKSDVAEMGTVDGSVA